MKLQAGGESNKLNQKFSRVYYDALSLIQLICNRVRCANPCMEVEKKMRIKKMRIKKMQCPFRNRERIDWSHSHDFRLATSWKRWQCLRFGLFYSLSTDRVKIASSGLMDSVWPVEILFRAGTEPKWHRQIVYRYEKVWQESRKTTQVD